MFRAGFGKKHRPKLRVGDFYDGFYFPYIHSGRVAAYTADIQKLFSRAISQCLTHPQPVLECPGSYLAFATTFWNLKFSYVLMLSELEDETVAWNILSSLLLEILENPNGMLETWNAETLAAFNTLCIRGESFLAQTPLTPAPFNTLAPFNMQSPVNTHAAPKTQLRVNSELPTNNNSRAPRSTEPRQPSGSSYSAEAPFLSQADVRMMRNSQYSEFDGRYAPQDTPGEAVYHAALKGPTPLGLDSSVLNVLDTAAELISTTETNAAGNNIVRNAKKSTGIALFHENISRPLVNSNSWSEDVNHYVTLDTPEPPANNFSNEDKALFFIRVLSVYTLYSLSSVSYTSEFSADSVNDARTINITTDHIKLFMELAKTCRDRLLCPEVPIIINRLFFDSDFSRICVCLRSGPQYLYEDRYGAPYLPCVELFESQKNKSDSVVTTSPVDVETVQAKLRQVENRIHRLQQYPKANPEDFTAITLATQTLKTLLDKSNELHCSLPAELQQYGDVSATQNAGLLERLRMLRQQRRQRQTKVSHLNAAGTAIKQKLIKKRRSAKAALLTENEENIESNQDLSPSDDNGVIETDNARGTDHDVTSLIDGMDL